MFTTIDKAIVAIIMGIVSVLNLVFGINFSIDPVAVQIVISALTPLLVYLVPNKKTITTTYRGADRVVGRE